MGRSRKSQLAEDPREALGRWLSYRQDAKSEYSKILNERQNELIGANAAAGPRSARYQQARQDLEEARIEKDGIYGVVRRPLNRHHVSWGKFLAFVLVLAFLEGSVNKFLFDVTLGSFGFVSYTTSFVVSALIVIAAHFAGRHLRQIWSEYRRRIVWSSLPLALVTVAGLICIVSMLTVGRALTAADASIASLEDMFSGAASAVAGQGFWATLLAGYSDLNAMVLATVNFAGILVAILLAVMMHDPDKDYDLAASKVERHRAELDRLDDRYTKAKAKIIAGFATHLSAVSTRYKTANKNVMQLKHRLGIPSAEEDGFLIDSWDDLAETSELGDVDPPPEAGSAEPASEQRPPRLTSVNAAAGMRRA